MLMREHHEGHVQAERHEADEEQRSRRPAAGEIDHGAPLPRPARARARASSPSSSSFARERAVEALSSGLFRDRSTERVHARRRRDESRTARARPTHMPCGIHSGCLQRLLAPSSGTPSSPAAPHARAMPRTTANAAIVTMASVLSTRCTPARHPHEEDVHARVAAHRHGVGRAHDGDDGEDDSRRPRPCPGT